MPKRTKKYMRMREAVFEETGGHCYYCGCPLDEHWHMDHRTPLKKGGSKERDNFAASCYDCNVRKQNKTVSEYRFWLKQRVLIDLNRAHFLAQFFISGIDLDIFGDSIEKTKAIAEQHKVRFYGEK